MRIRLPATSEKIQAVKNIMRKNKLHSVCEEASCPNLSECFNHGTATFMILGAICTCRCPFCDVAYGRPLASTLYKSRASWHAPSPRWGSAYGSSPRWIETISA